ncbi:MAG: sulfurtransferase TusA family protein [Thermodesulfovibrionales bacterium]|nr:sulfurtransferase TusA family protein [Thermodesulfovibrionales bacterium]
MAVHKLDALGLKCPQPTLKVTVLATKVSQGDVIEVIADCPSFEKDVRDWCIRSKKVLLWIRDEGGGNKHCQIQF